ncbi:GGDEF domain-containing protein [bacterium]|nr:GGDEF domain-containing protein [bacterium]
MSEASRTQELEEHLQRLLKLLQNTERLHNTLDLEKALMMVLDTSLELTGMQRGFIMLLNQERKLEFRAGRDNSGKNIRFQRFKVSQTMIRKVLDEQKLFTFSNTKEFSSESVRSLKIQCGFCAPLFAYRSVQDIQDTRRIAGLLYADSKIPGKIGGVEEVLINSIALHAGLALENAYLFEMASLDGLTRLFQRHYSSVAAEIEWKRANRRQRPLSVLMIDVDNFKMINDTRGHDHGDSVLRTVAATLRKTCRLEDVISRYGGDEFMILLPETASDGAVLLAERIRKTFETTKNSEGGKFATVSIGIASYPISPAHNIEDLIKLADQALYRAKEAGRNRTVLHT